jgi:FKBP-type peptidyl-prolyl cis-trans isomerase
MKKEVILAIAGVIILAAGYVIGSFFPVSSITGSKLSSDIDTFAFSYGYDLGGFMNENLEQMKMTEDFSTRLFISGLNSGLSKSEKTVNPEQARMNIQTFLMKKSEEMQAEELMNSGANLEEGIKFLEENKSKSGIVTTESGLQYEVLVNGDGPKPKAEETVVVHYTGTLIDGTVFDSSVERGEPATFQVGGVIPGWVEALQLMNKGSKWKLYIPSELAYGPEQRGEHIKPNSVLIFEVELLDIVAN